MNELRLQRLEPILPSYDVRTRIKQDDLVFSRQAVQEATQKVNASFESLRLGRTPSFPIPAEKCVPIMATKKQVLEYESVFLNSAPEVLQDKTISEILQPYSYLTEPTKTGKIQFLLKFFSCIRGMNVVSILFECMQQESYFDDYFLVEFGCRNSL
jgi:hypothetical protein